MDDIPLNRFYTTLNKRLSPSPSTKTHKKPNSDTFVPMYPSSNQALQACAPAKTTNFPSLPTLFLDSSILADVCENIFQELNKLVQARNNLVHEDNYVKQWRILREREREWIMS